MNFVNEKIREFCTNRLIEEEMNFYKEEGVDIPHIDFLDNRHIIGTSQFEVSEIPID